MAYTATGMGVAGIDSTRRTYTLRLDSKIHELWDAGATPFLVYTRGAGKKLSLEYTGDPKPTVLVHTSGWADRRFHAAGAGSWSSVANGATISNLAVELTANGSNNVGFLIAGLMLRIKSATGDTIAIISAVDTQQQIDLVSISSSPINVADLDQIQVIGTAFAQGADKATATYDPTTSEYSYTQIFKTVVDVTGTLAATETFGGSEYMRLEADKRNEHLVDIERAILLGERGATTVGSDTVYTTYGMVTYIEDNSSTSNIFVPAYNSYTFDDFIDDMETWYSSGGNVASTEKLALCGSSVLAHFSKINSGKLWGDATVNFQSGQDEWGINVTTVGHPFGKLHLVHEPLFRGSTAYAFYKDYMAGVDLRNVKYMPLKANGYNRDTNYVKDLQTSYDKYINEYRTEVALLPFLAPTHALFKFS